MGFNIRILWKALTVILMVLSVLQFGAIFTFRSEADRIGLTINPWSDLWISAGVLLLIIIVRALADVILKPIFLRRLMEADPANFELKKNKVVKEFMSFCWYTFITIYGNLALWNHPYIPSCLIGSGTCAELTTAYGRRYGDPTINMFYMIQSAHHMYSLLDHVFIAQKGKDWAEMSLHHICAIVAIIFSYYTNQIAFGATILLIHDYGDVFLNLGKNIRDLKILPQYPYLIDIVYASLFIAWFVPRVFVISFCILPAGSYTRTYGMPPLEPEYERLLHLMTPVDGLQMFMVFTIMLLNLYWSVIILKSGWNKFVNKNRNFVIDSQGEKAH